MDTRVINHHRDLDGLRSPRHKEVRGIAFMQTESLRGQTGAFEGTQRWSFWDILDKP